MPRRLAHAIDSERPLDVARAAGGRRRGDDLADDRRRDPVLAGDADRRVGTSAGGTTAIIPRPPLNVARSSASSRPPSAPNRRMTDGIAPARRVQARREAVGGRARGTLPGRPPPVMWASPWRSAAVARPAEHGPGVDRRRRQQHLAERGHRLVRGRGQQRRRSPRRRASAAGAPGTARPGRGPTGRSSARTSE